MNKRYGLCYDTDSYKNTQPEQYPPGTHSMFDYIESRGGLFPKTVSFGLQYFLKEYMCDPTPMEDVEECNEMFTGHMGSYFLKGWTEISRLGYYPVRIRAVPEGLVVPTHSPLVTMESIDFNSEKTFWINTWIETSLMREVWAGTNVATLSYNIKGDIREALEKSSDNPEAELPFKLHDFGSRGVSSQESAMVGGAAHLINFRGTDTTVALKFLKDYYNQPFSKMPGFSIAAMEHSTVTSWGRDNEAGAYANMIAKYAKVGGIIACVSDSYDIWNAIEFIWGEQLKQMVIDSGATIVIRPDSGIPHEVVLKSVKLLDLKFGHTINTKGYKVLNNVRVIQGDGINRDSIKLILKTLLDAGYSATNIAFGMGGALLQHHNRDTQKFAMKCSQIYRNGKSVLVYKDPVTDPGKKSMPGRLDLIRDHNGDFKTVTLADGQIAHKDSVMRTVYENGKLLIDESFDDIRGRAI